MAETMREGFLTQLGLGEINEKAAIDRALGRDDPNRDPNDNNTMIREMMQDGGMFLSGVANAWKGKEKRGGFDYKAADKEVRDRFVEKGANLEKGQLAARRRMRKNFAAQDFGDMSQYDNKIKAARFMANQARQEGNMEVLNQSLAAMSTLAEEKVEMDRTKAATDSSRAQTAKAVADLGMTEAFTADGKAVTGQFIYEEQPDGTKLPGLQMSINGEPTFKAFGDELFTYDQSKGRGEQDSLAKLIRTAIPKEANNAIKNTIVASDAMMMQTERIIGDMTAWGERGKEIMSTPGNIATFIDDGLRTLGGAVSMFVPGGVDENGRYQWGRVGPQAMRPGEAIEKDGQKGWYSGINTWRQRAMDGNDPLWAQFGEHVQGNSTDAINHRARIMELAYMAARLAEPSNRGLSDNDINNALIRIAGSTSNPQALARRLSEMVADSTYNVEMTIGAWSGIIEDTPYTNEQYEKIIGGSALPRMRQRRTDMFGRLGLTVDPDTNKVYFSEKLGEDLNLESQDLGAQGQQGQEGQETPEQVKAREVAALQEEDAALAAELAELEAAERRAREAAEAAGQ